MSNILEHILKMDPDSLSSSETGVNPEIRSWKKHLSERARRQKAIGGIYFTNKWRSETLQPGLEWDNLGPRLKRGIFECISSLNGLVFGVRWSGVFWKRESRPTKWHQCCLSTRQPFFCLHIYSLCFRVWVKFVRMVTGTKYPVAWWRNYRARYKSYCAIDHARNKLRQEWQE